LSLVGHHEGTITDVSFGTIGQQYRKKALAIDGDIQRFAGIFDITLGMDLWPGYP